MDLGLDLQTLAQKLGGEVVGNVVRAPSPGLDAADRSMTVELASGSTYGFIARSTLEAYEVCRTAVLKKLGLKGHAGEPALQPATPTGQSKPKRPHVAKQGRSELSGQLELPIAAGSGDPEDAPRFIEALFSGCTSRLFFTALANLKGDAENPTQSLVTTDTKKILRFLKRYDAPGRAIYVCVATLKPNHLVRNKQNVFELPAIHAEVDLKDYPDLRSDEVLARLRGREYPPTIIVASGHGYHCYWRLQAPLTLTSETIERAETAMRLACRHMGGDPQVAECSRLMRLPGSHNSKRGDWLPVLMLQSSATAYALNELVGHWTATEPVPVAARQTNAVPVAGAQGGNSYLDYAHRHPAMKPAIDVDQALANMTYHDAERGIHITQLRVVGALINQRVPVAEILDRVLAATRRAAGAEGESWDWEAEAGSPRGQRREYPPGPRAMAGCRAGTAAAVG
jgi:hypothetical protein